MLDTNKLAHNLHRRRLANNPNAPRHQAAGEARFCGDYGYEPDLDDLDMDMNLVIQYGDVSFDSVSIHTNVRSVYEVPSSRAVRSQIHVFTLGEKLAETEVIGWLPYHRLKQAPAMEYKGINYTIDGRCLFPMPEGSFETMVFEEPQINVPTIWDYELSALWTPLGYHVYDEEAGRAVREADSYKE